MIDQLPATPTAMVVVIGGYASLVGTSGFLVTRLLAWVSDEVDAASLTDDSGDAATATGPTDRERDVGAIVGKMENVLVLTFVLVGAYTALAAVFAAKSIVRREDMKNDSLFYLAGTMVNFTYSVAMGAAVVVVLRLL